MRALTIGVVLLTATALFAQEKDKAKDKTEWHKASPKGSKIEALFPGMVKEEVSDSGSEFSLAALEGKAFYLLTVSPLPKKLDVRSKDDVKLMLDGFRDAHVKSVKGKLLTEKAVKIGKSPGVAFDVDCDLGLYRLRVYLTPTKAVQARVLGPKKFCDGADAKKFLDSLKIDE